MSITLSVGWKPAEFVGYTMSLVFSPFAWALSIGDAGISVGPVRLCLTASPQGWTALRGRLIGLGLIV